MAEHSKLLSPSASGLWLECTGQPQALVDAVKEGTVPPDRSSAAADLGTFKHDLAEQVFLGMRGKNEPPLHIPEGMEWNEFDWSEVVTAVEAAEDFLSTAGASAIVSTEMMVGFKDWRSDCFGTSDLSCFDPERMELRIGDYKFGRVRVSAEGNTQMKIYALALLETLSDKYPDIYESVDTIHMAIFQPKIGHEAVVATISMEELLKWDKITLSITQKNILGVDGYSMTGLTAGPHCADKYCDLLMTGTCPVAVQQVEFMLDEILDLDEGAPTVIMNSTNLPHFIKLMRNESLIKKTLESAFAMATSAALNGEKVEGFKLVQGKGRRAWTDEKAAQKYLKGKIPKDAQFESKFITAPKAEIKLKQAGKLDSPRSKNVFQKQVTWFEGKQVLVKESDPREEIIINAQEEIEEFFDLDENDFDISDLEVTADSDDSIDDLLDDLLS